MKKLLHTKVALIALFVAIPALAAGTAAAVGGGGGDESPAVVQPVDAQPAADREDDLTAADTETAARPQHAKPKVHTQSDPADTEEQDNEQADENDQGEDAQADEDVQDENEDVQDDDQGENDDAQGDEDDQGDQGDDQFDDQGGDD